jgi:AcrR family transcriptional regulator
VTEPQSSFAVPDVDAQAMLTGRAGDGEPRRGEEHVRERLREAALKAAGELLATRGLVALTMESVAARARISERAIRRWWPSEEALTLDVLGREWAARAGHILRGARGFGL